MGRSVKRPPPALPAVQAASVSEIEKVELHQHVDGSIPVSVTWNLMKAHGLNPVESEKEMERLLILQDEERGSLLSYLDKFHYPQWITQFYENIEDVVEVVVREAYLKNVKTLELRYSPIIHTFAGMTIRQAISAVLSGINRAKEKCDISVGLIVIGMRQQGPHVAKILARQAIAEAQHLHGRTGVVGFDLAGAERGNPPRLFREAYDIARTGGLGLTVHAGEDEGPERIWEAIDVLGVARIGHGCSAVKDKALLKRLARDKICVECCLTSNYQTGAVAEGEPHPILTFLEHGVPVAVCTDNTTVSNTDQDRENALLAEVLPLPEIRAIHRAAKDYSFIRKDAVTPSRSSKRTERRAR